MVVSQQPAKPLAAFDWIVGLAALFAGFDVLVAQPLVISLAMIVRQEFLDSPAQRTLAEEDHPIETLRIPLLGHQQSVPPQNRIGCEQRANFFESLAAEDLAFDGQTTPLIVVEQDAIPAELLFEHLVLSPQVFDHVLLLAVDRG